MANIWISILWSEGVLVNAKLISLYTILYFQQLSKHSSRCCCLIPFVLYVIFPATNRAPLPGDLVDCHQQERCQLDWSQLKGLLKMYLVFDCRWHCRTSWLTIPSLRYLTGAVETITSTWQLEILYVAVGCFVRHHWYVFLWLYLQIVSCNAPQGYKMDDLLTSYISLMLATMNKQKKMEQQRGASLRRGGTPSRAGSRKY